MDNEAYLGLKNVVEEMAARINAPNNLLPTYRISDDGARPHIVIEQKSISHFIFHFIIVERGQEIEHRETADQDELLYWVFAGITFSMACKYELKHRVRNQDFRKILFGHQEELLSGLSEAWKEKEIEEHKRILEKSPFDDNLN